MQPWYWWFLIFLLLFVIPAMSAGRAHRERIGRINAIKRRKGETKMNELVRSYIGKEVIIWAGSSSGVTGTMTKLEENWVEIEGKDGNTQILNTDYISRIQEYPRNKNGRKKAVAV